MKMWVHLYYKEKTALLATRHLHGKKTIAGRRAGFSFLPPARVRQLDHFLPILCCTSAQGRRQAAAQGQHGAVGG
jgi:hypothetical protein